MGMLTKVIVILLLILFITGQFTRSKEKRARRRQNITNLLLAVLVAVMLFTFIHTIVR
jgi:EamA domain-containing membrane protein RarD